MKLTKDQLTDLYDQILKLVKNKPPEFFNLRKMNGTVGLCYWTDIELDYRRDIIPTAFHELLHYLYPKWSETEIKYAESRLINFCTPVQVALFMKLLANKIYKSEIQKLTPQDNKKTKKRKKK